MGRFDNLIGQTAVKNRLNFYLDAFEVSQELPFLFFVGSKGSGKTEFAKEMGKFIVSRDGGKRPFVTINCGSLTNANQFFDTFLINFMNLNDEFVLFFDEVHELPRSIQTAFLTICATEKDHIREYVHQDRVITFNFKKIALFFATTDPQKVFDPLKDRLTTITFDDYTPDELAQIMLLQNEVEYRDNALQLAAATCRSNPRSAVHLAKEIKMYCDGKGETYFDDACWHDYVKTMGILPYGLNQNEFKVLQTLVKRGTCSLQELSAATGLSRGAVQRDIENYLMKLQLMKIDGQRMPTAKGVSLVGKQEALCLK